MCMMATKVLNKKNLEVNFVSTCLLMNFKLSGNVVLFFMLLRLATHFYHFCFMKLKCIAELK